MKISIVIPVYEMDGKGVEFLDEALQSIFVQSYINYEIIVSDHSVNNDIEHYLSLHENVKYFRNTENRGNAAANYNYAISKATGEIIKPLAQDDYFYSRNALLFIQRHLRGGGWLAIGRIEGTKRRIPNWEQFVSTGRNKLAGPSCIAYRSCDIRFDENLRSSFDRDLYFALHNHYGEPAIESSPLIYVRIHKDQLSRNINVDDIVKERKSVIKKWSHEAHSNNKALV